MADLLAAISANDSDQAKQAIADIKNLNKKIEGQTPVERACAAGADRVLAVLLDAGAKAVGEGPLHPFYAAAVRGRRAVMDLLVQRKAVPADAMDAALARIGKDGNVELLKYILERYHPAVSGFVIRMCAYSNKPEIIHALAGAGVDLNASETFKSGAAARPAFNSLVSTADHEILAAMIERGVDINARDSWGRTPLMLLAGGACERDRQLDGFRQMQKARGQEGDTLTVGNVTHPAPRNGEETLRLLIEHGADVKAKDNFGNDALAYYRCEARRIRQAENLRIIDLLKNAGATGDDATFRLFFVENGDLQTAKSAITAGADVNRVSPLDSHTPLTSAAHAGDLPLVDLLIKSGADAKNTMNGPRR